jgi:hypothetical protein
VAQHHWPVALLIGGIATATLGCPLIDAAVS